MNDAVSSRELAAPAYRPPAAPADARYHLSILVIATTVLLLAAVLSVNGDQVVVPLVDLPVPAACTFRSITGIDCPGCGLTRSFIRLVRADVLGAWSFNPAGLLVFAVVVFQIPYRSWQLWRLAKGFPPRPWYQGAHLLWVVVIGLFAQWLMRMFAGGIG